MIEDKVKRYIALVQGKEVEMSREQQLSKKRFWQRDADDQKIKRYRIHWIRHWRK